MRKRAGKQTACLHINTLRPLSSPRRAANLLATHRSFLMYNIISLLMRLPNASCFALK